MGESFMTGDYISIKCHDGASFTGVVTDIQAWYFLLNGYGHLYENVKYWEHT